MIHNLYKQRGETPLECLERFRCQRLPLTHEKMTYLGRLDPMAEGVLLVGSGEEDTKQKRREEFFSLDKDYDFTALFGFATDSYDVLGKIITHPLAPSLITREGEPNKTIDFSEMDLIKICKLYEGEREQKYPKYSSKMIVANRKIKTPSQPSPKGKESENPLPSEGGRGEVKKIMIYKMQFKSLETLRAKELFGRLLMDISKVKGDFRQAEILEGWKQILLNTRLSPPDQGGDHTQWAGRFSASVSSGTYIRSLINDMGNTLGCGACALSITRTRVGNYLLRDSIR